MIISRITPPGSRLYKTIRKRLDRWNFMDSDPIQIIGPWIMLVAGWAARAGIRDENLFWDWSSWETGILVCVGLAVIVHTLIIRGIIDYTSPGKNRVDFFKHWFSGIILFLAGFGLNIFQGLLRGFPFFLGMAAILLVYSIPVRSRDEKDVFSFEFADGVSNKQKTVSATILMIAALVTGFYFRDPVSSTAAAVILPFLFVAVIGKGIRHLMRLRFYGIFIPAMFIASRFPWFLIPLVIVFYTTRFYNFYKFQIVYPSFGIDYNIVRRTKAEH